MDIAEWNERLLAQSQWTIQARSFILNSIDLPPRPQILEVGSGTGIVLKQMQERIDTNGVGLDIDWESLRFHKQSHQNQKLLLANGYKIPFVSNHFDMVFCHYLLLWIENPVETLVEMSRVTKRHSWVCCFAEPDYLARMDYPLPLQQIGQKQNLALLQQGVRLDTGRQIAAWMHAAGLKNIHWGILGSHQGMDNIPEVSGSEWIVIENDLKGLYTPQEISNLEQVYLKTSSNPGCLSFIPTFYAYAQKS
jgi:SAM-dependent methyltransferase